ncbi:MAG: SLC13 family permease [Sphaerochaetaceae bacterium]
MDLRLVAVVFLEEGSAVAVAVPGDSFPERARAFIKRETVLVLACSLAIVSVFLVPPSAAYIGYIDFKVLGCLFSLMVVVAGFRKVHLFDRMAFFLLRRVHSLRQVSGVLVGITFFTSMWITNDVSLLTFVPFTLVVFTLCGDRKPILLTVVLQTVAANIGSSLTPVGNPQNLYIYSFYGMGGGEFFTTMLPLVVSGAFLLVVFLWGVRGGSGMVSVPLEQPEPVERALLVRYLILFIIAIASVFNLVPWYLAVVVIALAAQKTLLKQVDYSLLLTFVGFFIFVGNMGAIEPVKRFLERLLEGRVFLTSLFASQIISNVPATLLLAPFTDGSRQLLLGVNAGGCGTLIASLASVISFKGYVKHDPDGAGRYLGVFTLVNIAFVALFMLIWTLLLRNV